MQVWLISGCSTGFGRLLAEQALAAGHAVAATARRLDALEGIEGEHCLKLALDVTDPAACARAVAATQARFGRLDVLVNNAGYGLLGALEEADADEIRRLFDTNVFGLMDLTRAALPLMRAQRSGWIVNLSSIAGLAATPGFGIYNASKFAVEGLSEALAAELAPLGIRVLLVEPGPFRTDFLGRSMVLAEPMADYAAGVGATREYTHKYDGRQMGDPARAARAILEHIAQGRPELRMPLGKWSVDRLEAKLTSLKRDLDSGRERALGADFTE